MQNRMKTDVIGDIDSNNYRKDFYYEFDPSALVAVTKDVRGVRVNWYGTVGSKYAAREFLTLMQAATAHAESLEG